MIGYNPLHSFCLSFGVRIPWGANKKIYEFIRILSLYFQDELIIIPELYKNIRRRLKIILSFACSTRKGQPVTRLKDS